MLLHDRTSPRTASQPRLYNPCAIPLRGRAVACTLTDDFKRSSGAVEPSESVDAHAMLVRDPAKAGLVDAATEGKRDAVRNLRMHREGQESA